MATDIVYYGDDSLWGDYQYITLKELISNYMMGRSQSDATSLTPRYKVLYQAKRGIRELYYNVANEIRAVEQDLSPTLNITLPPDFVNYVRISWVDTHGKLHPFAEDRKMTIAEVYLQDNDYNLLFDQDGEVLQGEATQNTDPDAYNTLNEAGYSCYDFYNSGFSPNANMAENFPNGRFRINKSLGIIQFGSSVEGKSIVLEYISDGLYNTDDIKIHKFMEQSLLDFIYYQLIKNDNIRTTPNNEKIRARKEWYNSRRSAKKSLSGITRENLIQSMKGSSRWIKK